MRPLSVPSSAQEAVARKLAAEGDGPRVPVEVRKVVEVEALSEGFSSIHYWKFV